MSTTPVYCIICKAALVREGSPIAHGWSWCGAAKPPGWVCADCGCVQWEDQTEPNYTPEWLAFPRTPEKLGL